MRTSTIVSITAGTAISGLLAYAVYFDYQRRNNPDFRKALKRDARKQARKAKEDNEAQGKKEKAEIKAAVEEAIEDGFPTDIEEKEAFFLQQISQGEAMANDGSDAIGAALCFYKGLKVYPEPKSLIGIYDNTVPKNVLEILAQMVSHDSDLNVGSFGATRDSGSESGHGVESTAFPTMAYDGFLECANLLGMDFEMTINGHLRCCVHVSAGYLSTTSSPTMLDLDSGTLFSCVEPGLIDNQGISVSDRGFRHEFDEDHVNDVQYNTSAD